MACPFDEIGKRGESVWEGNLLFELLNNRYADRTDTIVIANLNPQDLAESLGPSITSRLNETGGVIHCDWPSRR
jgi:DNA replication protein DnaC